MEMFQIGTIVDSDPFLNNGFSLGSDFDSKLVLLVIGRVPISGPVHL